MAESIFRRFPSQDLESWADDNTWDTGDDGGIFFMQRPGEQMVALAEEYWEGVFNGGNTPHVTMASLVGARIINRGL